MIYKKINLNASFLRWCKFGVLQFTLIKPLLTCIALILEVFKLFDDGQFKVDRYSIYIVIIYKYLLEVIYG